MANPTFNTLKLKVNTDVKEITVNDKVVTVKQYLPLEEKINLIECVIQAADGGTVLNELAVAAYFDLYIIFKYTNIQFTDKQREDLLGLYDALACSGVIQKVAEAMEPVEYHTLFNTLERMVQEYNQYRNSIKAVVEQFALFAPHAADDVQKAVSNIDLDKFNQVMQLAEVWGINNAAAKV